jgi:hypothetical protein
LTGEHNHTGDYLKIQKLKAVEKIKKSVINNNTNNISIITQITKSLNNEVVQLMPKYKTLNDACTRIRNERFIDKNQCDD